MLHDIWSSSVRLRRDFRYWIKMLQKSPSFGKIGENVRSYPTNNPNQFMSPTWFVPF